MLAPAVVRRSECPISFALDLFGDRWTLLIVRDLGLKQRRTFSELMAAGESIASNILSERLSRLAEHGIVTITRDPKDGRRKIYGLTDKGKDLLPLLVEMIVWSARHDPNSTVPCSFTTAATTDRETLLVRLRDQLD